MNPPENNAPGGQAPTILDRARHPISRRDIDSDALKVLYRLRNHGFTAYLVGGAVRDLMLGRKPVDFDVGTNARPNQIKKLFHNAFLVGRRFRLAHVHFQGGKVIEISTFRRGPDGWDPDAVPVEPADEKTESCGTRPGLEAGRAELPESETAPEETNTVSDDSGQPHAGRRPGLPHRPIAFGTPAEDALRRDITINALFYDISTFAVIDYTGGLEDLEARRIRVIGDPDERFTEDPVRIWRVLRHAARLEFGIEGATAAAIPRNLDKIALCPGARLFEELYKDLKSGSSAHFFELARKYAFLPVVLGGVGRYYQDSGQAFARLRRLLSGLDEAVFRGECPSQEILFAALLEPWTSPMLADTNGHGDRTKILYELFRNEGPAIQLPKALLFNSFQIHVITDHLLKTLESGRMKSSIRKCAQYPAASVLCHLIKKGRYPESADAFADLYHERFGSRAPQTIPRRRRRPRRKRRPFQPAA